MRNPAGRIRRGKRRIRQCVTNGGCGVNALSALHVQSRRPDKTRQRRIRQCVTNGGCGVNALSALHVQSRRPDKTRQRRIRQCVTNGGCGINALSALHVQSRRPDKTRQASHPAFIAPLRTGRQSAPGWRYVGCCADKYLPARPAPMRRNAQMSHQHRPVVYQSQLPQSAHLPR